MRYSSVPLFSLFLLMVARSELPAQSAMPRVGDVEVVAIRSLTKGNAATGALLLDERIVRRAKASCLQIGFGQFRLDAGSWIEVKSLADGEIEVFDGKTLKEHMGESSYFNGDSVRIRLYGGPKTTGQFYSISNLAIGRNQGALGPLSLCGADNRARTPEPRVGRVIIKQSNGIFIGTAWLVNGHLNGFLTAGHNLADRLLQSIMVQFKVPLSSTSGATVNPSVRDQYLWTGAGGTKSGFENSGPGKDWGVFQTLVNTSTKKHAGTTQGAGYVLGIRPPASSTLRVAGFGFDTTPNSYNFVNQVSTGPYKGFQLDQLTHRVDTMGGNSGSPVQAVTSREAVAVHTHGGCTAAAASTNSGTLVTRLPFYEARVKVLGTIRDRCNYKITAVRANTSSVMPGQPIKLTSTLFNTGSVPGPVVRISYYFSRNSTISTSDTLLASVVLSPFAANKGAVHGASVTVPYGLATGTYYFGAIIDSNNKITEQSEGDNTGVIALSYRTGKVDLAWSMIGGWTGQTIAGSTVKIGVGVANRGTAWSPPAKLGLFLTSDKKMTLSDNYLGSIDIPPLGPRKSWQGTHIMTVRLPLCLSVGHYYRYFGWIDFEGKIPESNKTNNQLIWNPPWSAKGPVSQLPQIEFRRRVGTMTQASYTAAAGSTAKGGIAKMCLVAPKLTRHWYLCVWSGSPTFKFDAFSSFSLSLTNTPMFSTWLGKLSSSSGRGKPTLNLPPLSLKKPLVIYTHGFFWTPGFTRFVGMTGNSVKLTLKP